MARAIEKIERDIAALEEATSALAQEFYNTYDRYLTGLGQAMRQQLILASYHLCTQGYPDAFLSLSFSQRQQLQQAIRQLGENAKQKLLAQLHSPTSAVPPQVPTDGSKNDDAAEQDVFTEINALLVGEQGSGGAGEFLKSSTGAAFAASISGQVEENLGANASPVQTQTDSVRNPEELAAWQEKLETAIAKSLQRVSRDTNRQLQRSGILSKKLPEPVLEAAAKVEASGESVPGLPNLLNLVIETENDSPMPFGQPMPDRRRSPTPTEMLRSSDSQSSTLIQLIAIHLRLSEIEFADSLVAAGRHQIRNLSAKLSNLRRDYQKKQRERAVAEAESAWRVSWFDE
ncbi:hypothetical protein [Argonema galeatum]|uniref:hypothetical protein n=1 Tax=Argonema galeatum TaxID=2942762 RepID=UPI0020134533|nr:hypothetical protein [Argonema galeatum]MCL1467117.1 hypothetical protein [Argonema galeatum A003/A1]